MPRRAVIVLAVAAAVAAPAAVARAGDPGRIVGGTPAQEGEYPAQALVRLAVSGGALLCGGTVVHQQWVVTAAHCFFNSPSTTEIPASSVTVTTGRTRLSSTGGQVIQAQSRAVHDDYQGHLPGGDEDNDIAVIELQEDTQSQSLPVIRATDTSLWTPGTLATIVGWGNTTEGGTGSDALLEAQVPIVSDPGCASAYGGSYNAAAMVCAGYPQGGTDTCQGDSGGPLMVKGGPALGLVLAGITSFGQGCGRPGFPGVYTRLGANALNAWLRDRVPLASFSVDDSGPNIGETLTFTSTSTVPSGSITGHAWDTDDDGAFDDGNGPTATAVFQTPGPHRVRVQVTPSSGPAFVGAQTIELGVAGSEPVASFGFSPLSPAPGEVVTFTSTSTDPQNDPLTLNWDLDGDGGFDDATGPTAQRAFPAGTHTVGLEARDPNGTPSTATQVVTVAVPPPPPPAPERPPIFVPTFVEVDLEILIKAGGGRERRYSLVCEETRARGTWPTRKGACRRMADAVARGLFRRLPRGASKGKRRVTRYPLVLDGVVGDAEIRLSFGRRGKKAAVDRYRALRRVLGASTLDKAGRTLARRRVTRSP